MKVSKKVRILVALLITSLGFYILFESCRHMVAKHNRDLGARVCTKMRFIRIADGFIMSHAHTGIFPQTIDEMFMLQCKDDDIYLEYVQSPSGNLGCKYELLDPNTGDYLDGWGNPIKLVVQPNGQYVLVSMGPNGADDNGQGDDFVYPISF